MPAGRPRCWAQGRPLEAAMGWTGPAAPSIGVLALGVPAALPIDRRESKVGPRQERPTPAPPSLQHNPEPPLPQKCFLATLEMWVPAADLLRGPQVREDSTRGRWLAWRGVGRYGHPERTGWGETVSGLWPQVQPSPRPGARILRPRDRETRAMPPCRSWGPDPGPRAYAPQAGAAEHTLPGAQSGEREGGAELKLLKNK